jgi:hypothetical protein
MFRFVDFHSILHTGIWRALWRRSELQVYVLPVARVKH